VRRAAAILLLAAAPTPATVGQRYAQIVALYASGERAAAVSQVREIPEDELKREVKELRNTQGPGAPDCPLCDQPVSLHAALMLHTDRALADRRPPLQAEDEPSCLDSIHLRIAEEIAEVLAYRGGDQDDSARRWAAAMAMRARAEGCPLDAVRFADLGLKWYARDPTLLLVRGVVHETIATVVVRPERTSLAGLTGSQRQWALTAEREYQKQVDLAIDSYENALAVDPARIEPRVRLGRAEWLAGRADEARVSLETALRSDPLSGLAYLAHLFLGRCDEDAGRLEDAQREYRAALALDPGAQVAGVALSHVLLMSGDEAAAQRVLKTALDHPGQDNDVYWSYPLGGFEFAEHLFAQLRKESLR
jgi:tetratricopeptide (TPR) repeat protein